MISNGMNETPRHFALQLGALIALYASIASLITLLFRGSTLTLPDPADSYWQASSAQESMRFAFAALLIFFPTYLGLTRTVNVIRRRDTHGEYLGLTRWLIYLSLLLGGGIILGDAVAVLYSWLNGELTLRFFLKSITLAGIVTVAFTYYLLDAKGYWQTHERYSLLYGLGAIVIVAAAITWALTVMDSPAEVRESRIDERQTNDLQDIQYRIQDYLVANEELPPNLATAYVTGEPPMAPPERSEYRYERTGDGFQLCAEFATTSERDEYPYANRPIAPPKESTQPYIENPHNWRHEAGEWCFTRTVNSPSASE